MFQLLKSAWRRVVARPQWERDMEDELRFHIEARTAHLVEKGIPKTKAARQARVEFGGVEAHKELCRETSFLLRAADELRRNLSYSLRSLRKSPGFTTVGVLSLGLGIGANIATFSLLERLMLNDLPVRDPQGLYQVRGSQSYVHFEAIRSSNQDIFTGTLAWSSRGTTEVQVGEHRDEARTISVSGSYFPTLGVQAHLGRVLTEQDDLPGSANVAMLGYAAWQRLFGGDARAVHQTIRIRGVPFQVIGIAPAGFYGTELGDPPELFITIHGQASFNKNLLTSEGAMWLHTMVRLRPGVPFGAANDLMGKRSMEEGAARHKAYGRLDKQKPRTLQPGAKGYSETRNEFSKPLMVLMTLVGIVLLIACANLSTLLFVRGAGRSGEMSLRLALGASHGQLIRQWLTECMIIAAAGGILAVLLARWIVDLLLLFVGKDDRRYLQFHANSKIVVFAFILTIAAGLLFGLIPSWRAAGANPGRALKESRPSAVGRRRRSWRWMLAAQIAGSLVLVTGAALFARTLRNLSLTSGGFARSEVVWAGVKFNRQAPIKGSQMEEAIERLRRSPVLAAVSMGRLPLRGGGGWNWATVPGYVPTADEDNIVYFSDAFPGYFRAMNIQMLSGSDFEDRDRGWPPQTIIVSESFAKHYFHDRSPLGAKVSVYRSQPQSEIIGVVHDTKYAAFTESRRDIVYSAPQPGAFATIVARPKRAEDKAAAFAEIRAAIKAVAPNAEIETGTMEDLIQQSIRRDRLVGQLSAIFGLLGLIIASIGLYGAMAYEVSSRTREIGIRIALGASSWAILRTALAEVGVVLACGLIFGIPACLVGTRFIQSLLFEVSPSDPAAFAVSAAVLTISALLAALPPARRATRLDPTQSLRHE